MKSREKPVRVNRPYLHALGSAVKWRAVNALLKRRQEARRPWGQDDDGSRLCRRVGTPTSDRGQRLRRTRLQLPDAVEKNLWRDLRPACIEAGAEFLEQLGFGQGAVGMALGPPHLLALDAAAGREVDADLVPNRSSGDLRIVVLVGFDANPADQVLDLRAPNEAVGVFGEARAPRDHRR